MTFCPLTPTTDVVIRGKVLPPRDGLMTLPLSFRLGKLEKTALLRGPRQAELRRGAGIWRATLAVGQNRLGLGQCVWRQGRQSRRRRRILKTRWDAALRCALQKICPKALICDLPLIEGLGSDVLGRRDAQVLGFGPVQRYWRQGGSPWQVPMIPRGRRASAFTAHGFQPPLRIVRSRRSTAH